ncbi:MAG: hypothetical protein FJ077_06955 [Cyanobacteria bacterium K_DeepCast_35m_m2_023]|nr:hypothetical protein [Cyanobacteria bacterium K_DeepCast_35m_m2_023]
MTLAAARYNDARRYDAGQRDDKAVLAYATEYIMVDLDGINDEAEVVRVATFHADSFSLTLAEILAA